MHPTGSNVLDGTDENVPVHKVRHVGRCQKLITKGLVGSLAIEKYRTNGKGITIWDLIIKFPIKKAQAQRSLKHFHSNGVLFTAQDLVREGIHLLQNKNPQEYFAACMKSEILENLKNRKSVPVQPTGVYLPKDSVYPLSNALEHQKTHSFLETLVLLAYAPPYIHKLLLTFHLDKKFYNELKQREQPINRAKTYEENIARRHVISKWHGGSICYNC